MGHYLRIIHPQTFLFATLLAVVCIVDHLACAQSTDASTSTDNPASFGSGLIPNFTPANSAAPLTKLKPHRAQTAGGAWLQQASPATSSSSLAPPSAATIAGAESMQPLDGQYLQSLEQAAPPEIRTAGLTEATLTPGNQVSAEPPSPLPPGTRDGVFQKIYFTGTYLPALTDEPDALGFGELETGVVFGFPFFRRETPLLITPQFGVHFLENADALDIPDSLYDSAIEFRHLRKFGASPWAMDVAATVGYYSDFEHSSDEAVRVSGRAIGVFESSPNVKWLLGVAYVNRAGASVLPVAGVIYEPRPDLRIEALFPRPRVAWRAAGSTENDQRWFYVAGEFGGGVWAVTRPSNAQEDLLSYSDWRLLVGTERKIIGGLTRRFEVGYVFNREIEYDADPAETPLDDTLFARVGLTY